MNEDTTIEALLAQLAQERALAAQERARADRAEALTNGTFFSTIDDVWKKEDKNIKKVSSEYSFVRCHHVADRYEKTVKTADEATSTGNLNDDTNVELVEDAERNVGKNSTGSKTADSSQRSKASDKHVDIFGEAGPNAASAHLLPHATICSSYWIPVVPLVLSTGEITLSWDFMQKCIHGTIDPSTRKRIPHVGIKHFPTNRIRLVSQEIYLDKFPCVIIVPIMTLEEVRNWQGERYDAIVLAGNWSYKENDNEEPVVVPAAKAYEGICAWHNMLNIANCLAIKDECSKACLLLEQFIVCVCKTFNGTTDLHKNFEGAKTRGNVDEWKKNIPIKEAPVPVSGDWNDDTMKVRKVSFAESKEMENPAPDPVLLLAKAASNWLKRHEILLLPGCGDDDSSSRSDDSTDSDISYTEEESIRRWSHTAKKPCIAEVNININREDVEEPLSDDEFLLDK
jgi:hypothetical protein